MTQKANIDNALMDAGLPTQHQIKAMQKELSDIFRKRFAEASLWMDCIIIMNQCKELGLYNLYEEFCSQKAL